MANPHKPARRVAFDLARLFAAYAIIWIHTPRSEALAWTTFLSRFAVPFFVFATIFFVFESLRRNPDKNFGQYSVGRILRIYVPFMAWNVVYLLFKGAKSILLPDQPNEYPGIELLWTGSFYHLWFMPFILMVSLVAFLVAKMTLPLKRAGGGVVTALFLGMAIVLSLVPLSTGASEYAMLIFNATPAVLMGISLAIFYGLTASGKKDHLLEHRVVTVLGLLLFVGATATLFYTGHNRLLETLAGLGFMLMALAPLQAAWAARLAKLGGLAYGIYLSHLLLIKVVEAVASKAKIPICWELDLVTFIFAAVGSTLLAWLLSRWKVTKWLVA